MTNLEQSYVRLLGGGPGFEGLLHVGVGEEGEALLVAEGADDFGGGHVGALREFGGGDADLAAEAVGVGDGGAVDDAVEAGPEGVGHAHGARLAGGVEGVATEGEGAEAAAGAADAAEFGVGARVVLTGDGVEGTHEADAGEGVDDLGAEGDGMRREQGARGPAGERGEALDVCGGSLGWRGLQGAFCCAAWGHKRT